ncbi:ATP-NAD kinase-like domain-containing protein [Podospora appendiculata]|uniref:ATP-NAD kinase-like domain-containing protein n=1 Tax=Podospora appendiculata TaxID=314037 RepID=A0AAE0X6K6_9PEZI|nr:ATP-NAD kinase-like domain-containing protein [Podospora appendiculata]
MAAPADHARHISFEDVGSSASDEDHNAVEVHHCAASETKLNLVSPPWQVLFDPSNPYRRKSSLVANESQLPAALYRKQPRKTECLVHQFLDSQRRSRHLTADDGPYDGEPKASRRGHQSRNHKHDGPVFSSQVKDISDQARPDSVVDPKGSAASRCAIVDAASSETDVGQEDEKEWKTVITQTTSELDLHRTEVIHSRLLSKKQLNEMAWGVRELSRRLGSVRLRFKVKTIFLLTKIYDEELIPKTRELTRWLLDKDRDVRYVVYVDQGLRENREFDAAGLVDEVQRSFVESGEMTEEAARNTNGGVSSRLRYWDDQMCRTRPHTFDFVITLGGDGTVLYASWLFQRIVPPVLSFALGSLGFLTKFDFEEYQQTLTSAFSDGVTVSLRLRFEGTVMRSQRQLPTLIEDGSGKESSSVDEERMQRRRDLVEELIGEEKEDEHTHRPDGTYEVLNEVVVDRGPNPTMSFTEIFGDDEHFTSVLADGVCVSTPTGSTAYNLAAGGSLCHPENPVMLVTAICAHTLNFRPIILPDTIVLRIGVPYDARTSAWASFDGRERIELRPGDYVTISASRYPFASVQFQGRRSEDWINSISAKLGWNTRQKQKLDHLRLAKHFSTT